MTPADLTTILRSLSHLDTPISFADADSVTLKVTQSVHYGRGTYEDETYYISFTYAELLDPVTNSEALLTDQLDRRWQEAKQSHDQAERAREAREELDRIASRKRELANAARTQETKDRAELARLKAKYENGA